MTWYGRRESTGSPLRLSQAGRIAAIKLAILSQVSDTIRMGDQRARPEADRILVAQLTGEARHHARWRPLTGGEEAAALAELRALAGGRADFVGEVGGS